MLTIKNFKQKLIKKAKEQGITENFGQKELRKLKDNLKYNPYGSPTEREIADQIDELDKWAMNFNDKTLKKAEILEIIKKENVFLSSLSASANIQGTYDIFLDYNPSGHSDDMRARIEEKIRTLGNINDIFFNPF